MFHSDVITLQDIKLELSIDMDENPTRLYISFNPLMELFNFSLMDKTVDDVTCALLGTEYRDEIRIEGQIEYFEEKKDEVSKQLWVTTKCLHFLAEESNAPFLWDEIIDFIDKNEQELIQELVSSINV